MKIENLTGIELCIAAANIDETTSQTVLADHLRRLWSMLTPGQKLVYMGYHDVVVALEEALPDGGQESFDRLASEMRDEARKANNPGDFLDRVILKYPEFAIDAPVDGSELIGFVGQEITDRYQKGFDGIWTTGAEATPD